MIDRLKEARQLIAENRTKSIDSLSRLLNRIYLARAEDEITVKNNGAQPARDAIRSAALDKLRAVFNDYGDQRGPLLAKLSVLAQNTDIADEPLRGNAVTRYKIARANEVRGEIRALDAKYETEASALLAEAQKEIEAQIKALEEEAQRIRQEAVGKARAEAESEASKTQTSLDVQVNKLVPESMPSVPAQQVTVPGASQMPSAPVDTSGPIFGSLDQRRQLINREVDLWIRSTGNVRSATPRGAHDGTEEFLGWISAHRVGP